MNEQDKKEMERIQWWHTIDFGNGNVTDGMQKSILHFLKLPPLKDKSVLDIGAWDGYYSFVAEQEGAKDVLAVDSRAWRNEQACPVKFTTGKDGFNFARRILKSKVRDMELEVPDILPTTVGKFDIVFCFGILYHMQDPFLVIRNLAQVTRETLVIETHVDMNSWGYQVPVMVFYPGAQLNNDASNWWGPNLHCVIQMCFAAGFKEIEVMHNSASRCIIHAHKEVKEK